MEHMLQHANLSESARDFWLRAMRESARSFRPREVLWQLKLMSRYTAERAFFQAALEKKQQELSLVLPFVKLMQVPPPRSTPFTHWQYVSAGWPDPVMLVTQLFLHQILSSSDLFLDLGSRTDALFLSEQKDFVGWVPESAGTRWHEIFRSELARLYLGWAFDQQKLTETALQALHMTPLAGEVQQVLAHWRDRRLCRPQSVTERFQALFRRAEALGIHLHPNVLVWALYELEVVEVLARMDATPNLEHCADELCRLQSRISA